MYADEEWKDIDGFKGYKISNYGRVMSFKPYHSGQVRGCDRVVEKGRIMSTKSDDGNGYLKVMLRRGGKSYCRKIHRLVAEAFVKNVEGMETVDHINNNKKDNRATNLRWISRSENVSSAYADGLHNQDISNRRIPYMTINTFTMQEDYFSSREEVADFLEVDPSEVSHSIDSSGMGRIKEYDVYRLVDGRRRK